MLLLILFGIIDFGLGFHRQLQVTRAAGEGARVLALGGDSGEAEQKVTELLGGEDGYTTPTVTATECSGDSPQAAVDVTLYYSSPTGLGALMSRFGGGGVDSYEVHATGVMACVG